MITRALGAAALVLVALVLRAPLEALPLTHVLVQLPMLALAGAVLAPALALGRGDWNRGGWACLIVAGAGIAFWMLPRSIDAALSDPLWEIGKFVSLPLLVGLPLHLGWARAHPLLRGVLKAQVLSMLGVLAFLYTHAPVRLCNAYLVEDQHRLGLGFLALALALAASWVAPLIFPRAAPRAGLLPRERIA
ncbi:MAG: hypothetical protein CVT84_00015 [Alphaproteobacteria bacterium HGW-Alphaproteobacteria-6]|nr:MAG: hypothetical protein CVT84_00015 [Alphaproteobacteria bacterium HGW-Alphaproteobacteria-6]